MQKGIQGSLLVMSFVIAAFVVSSSTVLAVAGDGQGPLGTTGAIGENVQEEEQNLGEETQIQNQNREQIQVNINEEVDAQRAMERKENTNNGGANGEGTVKKNEKTMVKSAGGQANADAHRATVAIFVLSLKDVADEEKGIGNQVREIAQQQNEAKEKVAEEIEAVQKRSKVKTFFLGADHKNLGELRSEMVKAKAQTQQLENLAEKAENSENKAELQAQVQALEQEQIMIQEFITENEDQFSLFGWAFK